MKSKIAITLVVSVAILAGCRQHASSLSGAPAATSADANPNDAIRTAIQAHLAHNGNLNLTMQLTYALAKRDGAWSVVESIPGGSNFSHPALDKTQSPAAGGTMGADSAIFRALDNFHGGAAKPPQNLPPGHPPK